MTEILRADFAGVEPGPVTSASFRAAVSKYAPPWDGAYLGMSYRPDYRPGSSGNVVRTELAANVFVADEKVPGRGNVLPFRLPVAGCDEATMSYDVRFAAPFDFSAGGKLPGFVGVAPGYGPGVPTGGGPVEHGFSARLMWHGAKMWRAVRDAGETNLLETYLYHPGQVREFGDDLYWNDAVLVPGRWHTVQQTVRLNTIGQADGMLRAYFDGRLVLELLDVVYRTDPLVKITHFDWSIFRGGGDRGWASPTVGYVDLDNLAITVP